MRLSRWIVAPVAAAALLAVGAGVFAAGAPAAPSANMSGFWSAVASKVGVSATALESAVQAVARQDHVPGTYRWAGHEMRHGRPPAARGGFLKAAAGYLGVTPQQLIADLRGGQSLSQIATANGKTQAGLEAALSAQATQDINAVVQRMWTRTLPAPSTSTGGAGSTSTSGGQSSASGTTGSSGSH